FKPVFNEVKPFIESTNLAIGNLETTISGKAKGYSGYPIFNSPKEFLEALKYAGFDLLLTANNHSLDKGAEGVFSTIDNITKHDMLYNGTFKSKEDRDSIRVYIVRGIRICLLAYTYASNINVKKGEEKFLISVIDTTDIKNDLMKAENLGPDLIMVYLHFGDEYSREPSLSQRDIVAKLKSYGADIIFASHPHVLRPLEFFESKFGRIDTGFVAYSLGNFISNQRWRYSDCGVIINFTLEKNIDKDTFHFSKIEYIPTWVFKGDIDGEQQYKILPSQQFLGEFEKSDIFLTNHDVERIRESYYDTIDILTRSSKPRLQKSKNNFSH
ncbi:MAG: hypothetical protein A2V66_16460, partial [Ignavibacteria bacterium RBG_13_36_8]